MARSFDDVIMFGRFFFGPAFCLMTVTLRMRTPKNLGWQCCGGVWLSPAWAHSFCFPEKERRAACADF